MAKKPDFAAALDDHPEDEAGDFQKVYGGLKLPAGLQQATTALSALDWIRQSPNALTIDVELSEAEWFLLIQSIETIQKRYQWYLGDSLVYGIDREYGKTAEQMARVAEITGKDEKTLHDYYKTALLFEYAERSDNLEFEPHRVLARAFSDDTPEHRAERLRWLHIAETEKLSGRRLSAEIAKAQLPASADGNYSEIPNSSSGDATPLPDEIQEEATGRVVGLPVKEIKKTFNKFAQCVEQDRLQDMPRDDLYILMLWVQDKYNQRRKMDK